MKKFLVIFAIFILIMTFQVSTGLSQISADSLKKHVYFLASDSMEGRHIGTPVMDTVRNYLIKQFKEAGIEPIGQSYLQAFPFAPYYGENIIGVIEGSDPQLKNEYILLGAHYDHLGWYMKDDTLKTIYNGADDNASGTAGIIEIGRLLANNKNLLKRSVIIAAFDGEEEGLWGSTYFIKHPPVDIKKIKGMLSIDMIGWLKKGKVVFSGCGSFADGTSFMNKIKRVEGLKAEFIDASILWKDRTDTKPFYDSLVPCMYVSTGIESPYHKPEDDADSIDYEGMSKVCQQIYYVTVRLSAKDNFQFEETHESIRMLNSSSDIGFSLNFNNNYHHYTEGPYEAKMLMGFGGGLFADIGITDWFYIRPEVQYLYYGSQSSFGNIRLHSIDIPLSLEVITKPDYFRGLFRAGGYANYSFAGYMDGKKIDWIKQGLNRLDYGLQLGFGFQLLNIRMEVIGRQSLTGFYKNNMLNIGNIGKAKNSTAVVNFEYLFTPW